MWCSELSELQSLTLDRKLFEIAEVNDASLHVFSNASQTVYDSVADLGYFTCDAQIKVSFNLY